MFATYMDYSSFIASFGIQIASVDVSGSNSTTNKKLHDGFQLPIQYLDKSKIHALPNSVAADLELCSSASPETKPIYDHVFEPTTTFARNIISEHKQSFTTDTAFLKETQQAVRSMPIVYPATGIDSAKCDKLLEIWKELKDDADFLDRYSYMDWDMLTQFNESAQFLQTMSVINLMSPITSFLMPVFFFVLPFLVLKFKGIPIDFTQYIDTLREIAKGHFIGKLLNIRSFSFESLGYIAVMGGLYVLQMYQNTMTCIRFYKNLRKINEHLEFMRTYVSHSIATMESFIKYNGGLNTYSLFCRDVNANVLHLANIRSELESITPFCHSPTKAGCIGYMLKCFYRLHKNPEYDAALRYSMGFEGYLQTMLGVYSNKRLSPANYIVDGDLSITTQHYPELGSATPVVNDCRLDKNMIITGVNASGKTTYIKTTAINVLLSQQIGSGFYETCSLVPYTHIHSYLNIPDTSGRDSLFQAESRRCKEIIDSIASSGEKAHHFAIFDELYSGTNPDDATIAAYSFLKYLTERSNVDFLLTTHYVSVCKKFRKSDKVRNFKMAVSATDDGRFEYLYKIKRGISKLHGGAAILKNMGYPKEILDTIASGDKVKNDTPVVKDEQMDE